MCATCGCGQPEPTNQPQQPDEPQQPEEPQQPVTDQGEPEKKAPEGPAEEPTF